MEPDRKIEPRTYKRIDPSKIPLQEMSQDERMTLIRDCQLKRKKRNRIVLIVIVLFTVFRLGLYGLVLFFGWNETDSDRIEASYINEETKQIIDDFEKNVYEDLDAIDLNYVGLSYVDEGRYDEGKTILLEALDIVGNDLETEMSIYNNLSWASNEMGDYEQSAEYARKALDLGDRSTYIYTNYANALFNIGEYANAIANYKNAIDSEEGAEDFVYANIGECFYQKGDYETAVFWFEKYHERQPEDTQGLYDLAWASAMIDEDPDSGLSYINQLANIEDEDVVLSVKAEFFNYFGAYDRTYELLKDQPHSVFANDEITAVEFLLAANYESHFAEGIKVAEQLVKDGSMGLRIWYNLLDLYYLNDEHDKAFRLIQRYDAITEDNFTNLLEVAYMYSYNFYFREASVVLEKLVEDGYGVDFTFEEWENALYEWLYVLSELADYDRLIEVIEKHEDKAINVNTAYEMAYAKMETGDFDAAKDHLRDSIHQFPDFPQAYGDLMGLHMMDGELEEAERVMTMMVTSGLDDEYVESEKQYYDEMVLKSPSEWLFDYIEENYMYLGDDANLEELRKTYSDKIIFTRRDLETIAGEVFAEDPFSYFIYPDEVEAMMDDEGYQSAFGTWLNPRDYLLDIDFFSSMTDTEVFRILDSLDETKDKNLIIDLRQNYGGDADSAYHILDYLLPNMYLGEWSSPMENSYSYYSNGDMFQFDEVIICVDDETASSAEMIALGMKELSDNTTIVGETTYGKGVGQVGNVNMKHRFGVFVVNAYWTIGDSNIHEVGVTPDVEVIDKDLDEMIKAARRP